MPTTSRGEGASRASSGAGISGASYYVAISGRRVADHNLAWLPRCLRLGRVMVGLAAVRVPGQVRVPRPRGSVCLVTEQAGVPHAGADSGLLRRSLG